MTTPKEITAIESAIYGIHAGDTRNNAQDVLDQKLAHLDAMLTIICGCGGELFRGWSGEVQDNYMFACSTLASECKRLSEMAAGGFTIAAPK